MEIEFSSTKCRKLSKAVKNKRRQRWKGKVWWGKKKTKKKSGTNKQYWTDKTLNID